MAADRSRRLIRAVTAVVMAVSVLTPAVALGGKSEVDVLRDKLAGLRKEAQRAGDAYSKAYWKLDKTNLELAQTNKELRITEERLAKASARLSSHAAEIYRQGEIDYLALLLTSETLDDMLMRLEYAQRMGARDAEVVGEVEALQAELLAKKAKMEELRTRQRDEAAALKKKAAQLDKKLKSVQSEYEAAQKKYAAAVARVTGGSSRRYPAGPNGMVFPVQGPCYYTDTWGAARSGGRTHKGTDIMARSGTPCVAVLSGTVRARSNRLGGNTIWLTADNGWEFYYAHLSSYVRTSGRVQAGEVIGKVGSTGNASASAPHLHFEIHPNGGAAVNPYPYLKQME
ncbi:MAG: peptidoglycan DD-metalloendopeptidase family protein [Coriobacteriales bacterium]|nr:peptidoglycan DD-metalloendopeptidase family protein [Actinomycetes bacterium]